jgi:hypothetical protein
VILDAYLIHDLNGNLDKLPNLIQFFLSIYLWLWFLVNLNLMVNEVFDDNPKQFLHLNRENKFPIDNQD